MNIDGKKKRGRPKKEGIINDVRITVRIPRKDYELLLEASETVGKSKSDIIRDGVVMSASKELCMYRLNQIDEDPNDETYYEDDFDNFEDDDDCDFDEE